MGVFPMRDCLHLVNGHEAILDDTGLGLTDLG